MKNSPAAAMLLMLPTLLMPGAVPDGPSRLLRQPTISATQVAFEYGADLWVVSRSGGEARRLTSTPAIESGPHFSPDGKWIAFTSNRAGVNAVYVMPVEGGEPRRVTWSPTGEIARGWTPDGRNVLFSSGRISAPTSYAKLFMIPMEGGVARLLPSAMGLRGSFSPDARQLVVDRVDRWDVEYRSYRGGQNTPLTIVNLSDSAETKLPNERSMDIDPVWMGDKVYFLSDRDWATNVWSYDVRTKALAQLTHFKDADVKTLDGHDGMLVFEEDGWLWLLDGNKGGSPQKLSITVRGDFPWAEAHWQDVSRTIASASLGPSGKRAVFASRGDIFTVPVSKGDARNITHSPGAADHVPVWSPDGKSVAWISDEGDGYKLVIGNADGIGPVRTISMGDAKYAWTMAWSPDGSRISFVDEKTRIRVVDVATGHMTVADVGGAASDLQAMSPQWSPDSKWLAYSKSFPNQFRRVVVWSVTDGKTHVLTDALANATDPVWDRNGKWLYFLASTDLGLASGWADLGSLTRSSTEGVYVALLRSDEPTPFTPESDEEAAARVIGTNPGAPNPGAPPRPAPSPSPSDTTRAAVDDSARTAAPAPTRAPQVRIDFDRFDRRILALPMPVRSYAQLVPGPAGTVFVAERVPNQPGTTLHKWDMARRRDEVFTTGISNISASNDGRKLLYAAGQNWSVVDAATPPKPGDGRITVSLRSEIDPTTEWKQIFDEAWRIERDFFYAPNHHGADWTAVRARYLPLLPYVRHRTDLTYITDMIGGELSVAHSFVREGDVPAVDSARIGALGADLVPDGNRWRIARIYTSESWNPGLRAPLDAPGVKARVGDYLIDVNGQPVMTNAEPWKALDGTAERQTVLRLSDRATGEGSWTVTVVPVRSDAQLRQRAWIEDNRRKVDSLSGGKLAYVWVPNTSAPAIAAFDRYYFAQQDKQGAVIDERFNGGGLLDDYMVDIMARKPVGGVTTTVPGAPATRLPAAALFGPKVLLVNELAGSGGDYFAWVFHELGIGPEIGSRTWGGLVNAAVPYPLVDGGSITAPQLAVYGPNSQFIAEGVGVPPDIAVWQDARDVARGRDPQLERGVQEALALLQTKAVTAPPPPAQFPVHARRPPGE
ncbi:MAG TPA: PDZ domain-containing protein [Gemmatimonadaceae bacterium]|jgi:tricorn protease|nr:PDZ domain-containing protein [Gemmatimonadaceae bacterium]